VRALVAWIKWCGFWLAIDFDRTPERFTGFRGAWLRVRVDLDRDDLAIRVRDDANPGVDAGTVLLKIAD
jgi:hypothetical protein